MTRADHPESRHADSNWPDEAVSAWKPSVSVELLHRLFDLEVSTGLLRWKESRGGTFAGSVAGNLGQIGYVRVRINGRAIGAHRIVFAMVHGYMPPMIDHINGSRSDNRPENLREATAAENLQNAKIHHTNTSGVKGVCWNKACKKWQANCRVNGIRHYLGRFDSIADAERVVCNFREVHHKQFARHE